MNIASPEPDRLPKDMCMATAADRLMKSVLFAILLAASGVVFCKPVQVNHTNKGPSTSTNEMYMRNRVLLIGREGFAL